jgi:hypothetical protein
VTGSTVEIAAAQVGEVSWSLRDLDQAVGPLVPGRTYVIGSRPSNGKTAFGFSWLDSHIQRVEKAFRAPEGVGDFWRLPRRVLALFTERSPHVSRRTWAALRLGYAVDLVLREKWDELPSSARDRVDQTLAYIAWVEEQGWVHFVGSARPQVADVGRWLEERDPHVVLYDFMQRVAPEPGQTRWDAVSDLSKLLQAYASQRPAIVLGFSQIKRRGDGVFGKYRPPSEEDFKASGDIEEDADVGLGLFRPLLPMTFKDEREIKQGLKGLEKWIIPEAMALKVLKHRFWGDAADRLVRLRCRNGRVTNWDHPAPPSTAGDGWEPEESERAPF